MMNEKKPKWVCPVCNKAAYYENLLIGKDHRLNLDAKHFTFLIHKFHYDGKFLVKNDDFSKFGQNELF